MRRNPATQEQLGQDQQHVLRADPAGRDGHYKTAGIISGAPASSKTADNTEHYPLRDFERWVLSWFENQQHLYMEALQ